MTDHPLSNLFHTLSETVDSLRDRLRSPKPGSRDILALAEALLSGQGEASNVAVARKFLAAYDSLAEENRLFFLTLLDQQFGPDQARLERALTKFQDQPIAQAAQEMHEAAESRREVLFRRINLSPGGTRGLLQMREDVLRNLPAHPELASVDADFKHLFSSWFNRGFLVLRRIDWTTPANILEKIIRYEAVHEIASWDDLRRRLEPADRRCFAFFHPTMQDEPLIFVQVALTSDVPVAIVPLLADNRNPIPPGKATFAVFYSISSCQVGLKGISLGDFLIKQVVEDLKREFPSLKTFITLSPVPGFLRWLAQERGKEASLYVTGEDREVLGLLDKPDWHVEENAAKLLKPRLLSAVTAYLLAVKTESGKPIDPVARFHLGNGARLERIHWLSDLTPKGLSQAAGFMVNYLYEPDRIERNQESFATLGEIASSHAVRRYLRSDIRKRFPSPS
ncbi:MAG: malonyl-CoA decarboxylase [Deltaproteobacteria bacterium]|nr:malonyl-CoA decarboxylase [Deltaproteobacteria bacterium]